MKDLFIYIRLAVNANHAIEVGISDYHHIYQIGLRKGLLNSTFEVEVVAIDFGVVEVAIVVVVAVVAILQSCVLLVLAVFWQSIAMIFGFQSELVG
jgi:hypothetical protein